MLLTERHVTPVVTLFFSVTSGVTYETPCRASGHLLLPAFSRLPWGWQFNLKVSRASC